MPTRVAWRDDLPPAVPERPVHRADGRQRTLRLPADPLVVEVEVRPDPQPSPVDGHRQLCAAPVHGLPGHQGEMPQVLLIASRLHHPVELHRVRAVELNRCHRRWVRLFFVDGPRGFCQRHGKSYLTRRRRGGEGGGGGLLTGRPIPSAYRWAWCRWYSRVVEVPVRIEVAAGFVAPGASEPPRLQPSWPLGGSRPAHG